jgi:hypothetical protein
MSDNFIGITQSSASNTSSPIQTISPYSPSNDPSIKTISEADTFNRKKKKRKGFFRTLGFEKLYIPYCVASTLGSLTFAVVTLSLSIIYPTFRYCNSGSCAPFDSFALDLIYTVIGCAAGLLLLIIEISLILCPGALMEHPKVVKRLALFSIFLTVWSTVLSISPTSSKRSYGIPYNRIQRFNFTSQPIPANGTARLIFKNVFSSNIYSDYSRIMMRIYSTYLPYYVSITDYPVASNYYVYSDQSYDDSKQITPYTSNKTASIVLPGATVQRYVPGLIEGKSYAIVLLPAQVSSLHFITKQFRTTQQQPLLITSLNLCHHYNLLTPTTQHLHKW